MDAIIKKLLAWLPKNIASLLGIVQAIVKFGKEVATLFYNLICPLIPGANDEAVVGKIRDFFNLLDVWIEKAKSFLLSVGISQ